MRMLAGILVSTLACASCGAAADAAVPVKVEFGGLLQAQGEAGDPGDVRFDGGDRVYLRRARLNATAVFPERFTVRLEVDLAGKLSKTSSLRAQLTDGYVEWNRYAALAVRVGQFKTPFGFEQLFSDARLPTIERSLANDRLTAGRQVGLDVFGAEGAIAYAAGFFNGNGTNANFNDDGNFLWTARVAASPLRERPTALGPLTVSFGLDGSTSRDRSVAAPSDFGFDSTPATPAPDDTFAGKRRAAGADAQVRAGRFELWGEYLAERFEPSDAIPAARFRAEGWYALAAWFAIPERLQVVGRYETYDGDTAVRRKTETWTLGGNGFVRGDHLKVQVDWLHTKIPSGERQDKVLARIQAMF
jgi:phosphate-selective porin